MFIDYSRYTFFPYSALFRFSRRRQSRSRRQGRMGQVGRVGRVRKADAQGPSDLADPPDRPDPPDLRSEEHTSELQSHHDLVCRLLLEKKHKLVLLATQCRLY